jgi:manganese transport protein
MDGFLQIKIPCYQRRLITRALALIPAFIGVVWFGEGSVGRLLVLTQVVLTLQLPFALYPLIRFTGSRKLMGVFASGPILNLVAWLIFLVIVVANIVLLWQLAV